MFTGSREEEGVETARNYRPLKNMLPAEISKFLYGYSDPGYNVEPICELIKN